MKKFLLICTLGCAAIFSNAQSVSINTDGSTAAPSAMLDVKSTTKGLLIPRMTTAQRTAIPMPANGLMVYDTELNKFYYYNGTEWTTFSSGGGGFSLPFSQTLTSSSSLLEISNQGLGEAIKVSSKDGFGILATSTANSAIKAVIDDVTNFNPSFRAVHNGYGPAITAVSTYNHGIIGAASDPIRAGVLGINSGTGIGVLAGSESGIALQVEGNLVIKGGNTNPSAGAVLTSDATGNAVWKANRIAFRAKGINQYWKPVYISISNKMHFAEQEYDFGNVFSPSTAQNPQETDGAFVAPVDGVYHFDAKATISLPSQQNFTSLITIKLKRAGVTSTIGYGGMQSPYLNFFQATSVTLSPTISTDYALQAGDIVWIDVSNYNDNDTPAQLIPEGCYFNGHLVFAN